MSRTPKNLPAIQDRRAAVVRLRAQGYTWEQVAEKTGFADGSGALKAWKKAVQQKPDLAVTEVRVAERERLAAMDSELARIISQGGPIKTTSIGRVMYDVRTCSCGAGNTPDHEPGCTVVPVVDEQVVIAALRERRQVGESYRRLVNADVPAPATVVVDQSTRILNDIRGWHVEHPGYRPVPGVPPGIAVQGPGAITAWKAEQARRAAVASQGASGEDIVEAEIVEEDP